MILRSRKALPIAVLAVAVVVGMAAWIVSAGLGRRVPAAAPSDVRQQIERLSSGNPRERVFAAHVLGGMGARAEAAIPFLVDMLGDHADPGKAPIECVGGVPGKEAALALAKIGGAPVERLLSALEARNWHVRADAALALGEIGDPRAIQPLTTALRDPKMWVQEQACRALGKMGKPAVKLLMTAMKDEGVPGQLAAKALGEIDDAESVELLIALLKDKNPIMRVRATAALGGRRDARAVAPLIAVLKDVDPLMRSGAAWALGIIGDSRALDALVGLLKDTDRGARRRAAEALGRIGDPTGVQPLIEALRDSSCDVREAAAIALAFLKDARAVGSLVKLLRNDKDWNIRMRAAQALGKIGDRRAIEPLAAALDDPNREVSQFAVFALEKVTGEHLGLDPADWRRWWQENKTGAVERTFGQEK